MREKGLVLSKDEGFTLIEIALGLAVGIVILSGAVLGIYQVLIYTARANDQAVALTDVNRAALAIKNDLLMTQTTDLVDGVPSSSANLTWIDYTSSFGTAFQTDHYSAYSLAGKQLRRNYDGAVGVVGRNVTSLSFTKSGRFITVVISTSNTTPPRWIKTLTFSIYLRSEGLQ